MRIRSIYDPKGLIFMPNLIGNQRNSSYFHFQGLVGEAGDPGRSPAAALVRTARQSPHLFQGLHRDTLHCDLSGSSSLRPFFLGI